MEPSAGATMPYWIHAKIDDSAFSVIVETAREAMAKLADLAESENTVVTTKDLFGQIIDTATLQAEADQIP